MRLEKAVPPQYSKPNFFAVFNLVKSGRLWVALGKGSKKQMKSFCTNQLCPNHASHACIHFVSMKFQARDFITS